MGLEQDRDAIIAEFADRYLLDLVIETPQQSSETPEEYKNRVLAGISAKLTQREVELKTPNIREPYTGTWTDAEVNE